MNPYRSAIFSTIILLLSVSLATGTTVPIKSYSLDVSFTPERGLMTGEAVMLPDYVGKTPDSITFYLHGELSVDSVKVGNQTIDTRQTQVEFFYDYSLLANEIAIPLENVDRQENIEMFYSGHFAPSDARSPSDYMRIDSGGVFLRGYCYSLWFPVSLEDRSDGYLSDFIDVKLRTPEDFTSIFVGNRLKVYQENGQNVSQWQSLNTSIINVQCTAQRYVEATLGSVTAYFSDDPNTRKQVDRILEAVQLMLAMYSERYKKDAAVDQFHIMETPPFADISAGNVTGLTADRWRNPEAYEGLKTTAAHELVHAFVDIDVPRSDPLFALAIEGFAVFFDIPAVAGDFGSDSYNEVMVRVEKNYLKRRTDGIDKYQRKLPVEKPMADIGPDEVGRYKDRFVLADRSLLFLNYLQKEMGSDKFLKFLSELFNSGPKTYNSFIRLCEQFAPGIEKDIRLWMETTEYPDRFMLAKL
ncbi:MAG: hypothetical protein V3T31_10375 [candidate division Zixibacteria bacterium]